MVPWPVRQRVFDTFWEFAYWRQEVFVARVRGEAPPWVPVDHTNAICGALERYKFTNCYRAADRVSQYLIRNVIYQYSQDPADVIFRILFFKIFNLPSLWEWVCEHDGVPEYGKFTVGHYGELLDIAKEMGERLFNNAYMLTGSRFHGYSIKHWNYLQTLYNMLIIDDGVGVITTADSLREVFEFLLQYPGIAEFLAYQFAIDINYSAVTDFDEDSFTYPGGGAVRGIMKCFPFPHTPSVEVMQDIVLWMAEHQQEQFDRLGLPFNMLWGRPMHAIDIQAWFCETDKISRVLFPDVEMQGKQRIKERYEPAKAGEPIDYFFPPKWGINEGVEATRAWRVATILARQTRMVRST